ncbi:MAG: crotonobetainyl-CoA--carnitine CoA-transferase [Candidatus Omnitrophota bacterium]|nr:MAG: crotonobetainyl-CoA--carnitine CoA-transferase [Candidatus Omnitrophota bacterium]
MSDFRSSSPQELAIRRKFLEHYKKSPIPDDQLFVNLGLFLNTKNLSRILFMNDIYKQIIDVQGIIVEFGTRWGPNLSLFAALRGIYEPYNIQRKIVGFDTFEGFPGLSEKDSSSDMMKIGNLSCSEGYVDYLTKVMEFQEADNPVSHIKKFEIRKGDANIEVVKYLEENPETIIALAFFDFDIYEPTKNCLQAIKPHLVKGSLLCFDELNAHSAPGETIALKEVYGLNNIKLRRPRYTTRVSYFIIE